eukprot:8041018-Lingulodinium_polyedra.AAC.1
MYQQAPLDLFPLPFLSELEARPRAPRASRRAAQVRRGRVARANSCIQALNSLAGHEGPTGGVASASIPQRSSLRHIW